MKKYVSEYEKMANDFCKKHNVKMTISFKEYGKHFHDDTESRNIYKVRIDRNHKTYSFNFGDSIYNTNAGKRPTKYDILACLQKYDIGSFDDFISEYGYVIESNKDYHRLFKLYKACCKEYKNVNRLFSDCMEELAEIQ